MKWKLTGDTLSSEQDGYVLMVNIKNCMGAKYWVITKNGLIIDEAFRHKPTYSELSARVQCEKAFNIILTTSSPPKHPDQVPD